VVSAFTLGHSLTLLAGAAGAVTVPAQPVEVAIAGSILVCAVHAWRPLFPRHEAWIAGGFGLVHGLAFAGAIRELELTGTRFVASLLAFNLGIETVQALIVAVAAPLLIWMARSRLSAPLRQVFAMATGALAMMWLVERVAGQ
jgi:hypothetical protein